MIVHKHFDSTTGYKNWVDKNIDVNNLHCGWNRGYGGQESFTKGVYLLTHGDNSAVQQVEKLQKEIWEHLPIPMKKWELDVAGAFPNVGAYLANDPQNMYYQTEEVSETTPVRVWVGVTSSAGINNAQLITRGAVLSAFVSALAQFRSVKITPYTCHGGYTDGAIVSWDVETSPLIIADIMANLATPEVSRYLGLEVGHHLPNITVNGSWIPGDYPNFKVTRANLPIQPQDVFLEPIHLYDPMLKDPIKWVKNQLQKFLKEMEE